MKKLFYITCALIIPIGLIVHFNSCKKEPTIPTVTTTSISGITQTTASSGGNVTDDGGAEVTARGVCWCENENPITLNHNTIDGSGTGSFTSSLTSLTPGTTYYVRAYAINIAGTAYGNQVSFTSQSVLLPTLTTTAVTSITQTAAVSGGNVTDDGGAAVTARGVCWSTSTNPTTEDNSTSDGSGTGVFTSNLTGLSPNTIYYVRAYAVNSAGVSYGNQVSFTTLLPGQILDADWNVYNPVTIGSQVWMVENLKTTKYNDGTDIPLVTDDYEWGDLTTDAYCWYNKDAATYKTPYGALYNWYAINTGKLCPTGWHVPRDAEWTTLTDYLGGLAVAGGKLKETGTTHWNSPNTDATNETGFTALPGGYRSSNGAFDSVGSYGYWWSATELSTNYAWSRNVNSNIGSVFRGYSHLELGFSVRCVKDN